MEIGWSVIISFYTNGPSHCCAIKGNYTCILNVYHCILNQIQSPISTVMGKAGRERERERAFGLLLFSLEYVYTCPSIINECIIMNRVTSDTMFLSQIHYTSQHH